MKPIKALLALIFLSFFTSCGETYLPKSPFLSFASQTPDITHVLVHKRERRLFLISHGEVYAKYKIGLGRSPIGDKKIRGDGKTPEGLYYIDRKNPNSRFYLSLGLSYPHRSDIYEAKQLGKSAGGDIFIHGQDKVPHFFKRDWTEGCISLKNRDMEEIFTLVKIGTPILIKP